MSRYENRAVERAIKAFRDFSKIQESLIKCVLTPEDLLKLVAYRGSCIITVTPELALWILENMNTRNRKLTRATVERYSKAMLKSNGWRITGQGLIFTKSGRLDDGQHRLTACVEAEVSFQTFVTFGMDDDIFKYLDDSKPRRAGDIFQIHDVPLPEATANAMRWLMFLKSNGSDKKRLSNDDRLDYYIEHISEEGHADFMEACAETAIQLQGVGGFPKGIFAALLFEAGERYSQTQVREFMEDLKLNKHEAKTFRERYKELTTQVRNDNASLPDKTKLWVIREGISACLEDRRVSLQSLLRAARDSKKTMHKDTNA